MDQLFARILLLFVTGDLFSDTFQELIIHVNPKQIKLCEGASVNINCNFELRENYKVSWHYSKTPTSDCSSLTDKIHEDQNKEKVYTWPILKINSIKTNDSGWYYCKITQDIPVLKEECSDGAEVIVEANSIRTPGTSNETLNQTQNPTTVPPCTRAPAISTTPPLESFIFHEWWIWFAVAVGIAVVVVSIVAIYILTHDSKEIIYENTQPASESGRWTKKKTKMDICNMPPSKKFDTIKPLRKYDTYSNNRTQKL
ncbi:uncharacterized protein LOC130216155 [Danio aesculapii]|uniref:uncharacterized protein LOC130216155 n=1 Tax=Danio aesculapii TaxID=1142201 RepID=UPI0024C00EA7|nr:uncharacterized protein LOC130216155 [Danio aesculapii]